MGVTLHLDDRVAARPEMSMHLFVYMCVHTNMCMVDMLPTVNTGVLGIQESLVSILLPLQTPNFTDAQVLYRGWGRPQ